MIIKLLHWNVWVKEDPKNIVDFLKKTDADIICAQEVVRDSRKSLDVAKLISEKLGFGYFYHDADTWDNRPGREALGNAIFSRFPIVGSNYAYVQQPKHNPPDPSHQGRVYIEIKTKINDKELTVGTTHLSYTPDFEITKHRKDEIDALLNIIKKREKGYVFTGDLNSTPDSYTITQLEKLLLHSGPSYDQKSWTTKPEFKGFKEDSLKWRLDYVFNSKDINISDAQILECPYSDHLPIQIKIRI